MAEFIKKTGKSTSDKIGDIVSKTVNFLVFDVVNEVMNELGISNRSKAKVMAKSLKIADELGVDTGQVKKSAFKLALKRELSKK